MTSSHIPRLSSFTARHGYLPGLFRLIEMVDAGWCLSGVERSAYYGVIG